MKWILILVFIHVDAKDTEGFRFSFLNTENVMKVGSFDSPNYCLKARDEFYDLNINKEDEKMTEKNIWKNWPKFSIKAICVQGQYP